VATCHWTRHRPAKQKGVLQNGSKEAAAKQQQPFFSDRLERL
jgi:hypothetical protein